MTRDNQAVDVATLLKMMQEAGVPFMSKLEKIEDKLANQPTKDDMFKLRSEMMDRIDRVEKNMTTGYVPRDIYETRHAQLIERDGRIEASVRELDGHLTQWQGMQEGRLQAAKREIDDRFSAVDKKIDDKFGEAEGKVLSSQDRRWLRWTQIGSLVSIFLSLLFFLITLVSFIFPHLVWH